MKTVYRRLNNCKWRILIVHLFRLQYKLLNSNLYIELVEQTAVRFKQLLLVVFLKTTENKKNHTRDIMKQSVSLILTYGSTAREICLP